MPFEVVTIYNTQIMDNEEWYMIGPDQWLEGRKVARVIVNTNIPQGVTTIAGSRRRASVLLNWKLACCAMKPLVEP